MVGRRGAESLRHFRQRLSRIKDPRSVHSDVASTVLTSATSLTSSVMDLTSAGIAGAGVLSLGAFVVAGQVVKDVAGPAAVFSVIVALAVAVVAGSVYAEFRSRVPRVHGTTSYEYMYCLGGEALAFLTGWFTLLQYTAATAAIARGTSQNLDAMLQFRLLNLTVTSVGTMDGIDSHIDFIAFLLVFLVMVVTAASSRLPPQRVTLAVQVFVCIVLLFILVFGAFKTEFELWGSTEAFFEKGTEGIFTGAASMFCIFTSYEYVVTASDFSIASVRPAVIRGFGYSVSFTFFLMLSVTALISLLTPVSLLHTEVALVEAFTNRGIPWMRFLVGIPAMLAMGPALLGTFTQLVKLAYDMSCDGLLFHTCQHTTPMLNTPVVPVIIFGIFSSVFTMIFNLTTLSQLISFCSLAVSLLICVVVLSLKYHPSTLQSPLREQLQSRDSSTEGREYGTAENTGNCDSGPSENTSENNNLSFAGTPTEQATASYASIHGTSSHSPHNDSDHELIEDAGNSSSSDTDIDDVVEEYKIQSIIMCKMGSSRRRTPNEASSVQAKIAITLLLIWFFCCAVIGTRGSDLITSGNVTIITVLVFFLFLAVCSVLHLVCQPQDTLMNGYYLFVTPLGPLLPLLCMMMSIVMLLLLPLTVWIIVLAWLVCGLLVYLLHGIHHSTQQARSIAYERVPEEQQTLIPPPSRPRTYRPRPTSIPTSVQADPIVTRYQQCDHQAASSHDRRTESRDRSRTESRDRRRRSCDRTEESRDSGFDILRDEEERSHHRRNDDPMIIIARE